MGTRVALVSCVKSKRAAASPARELYTSQLFRGLRAYAEAHADAWYILSAEHGVLRQDDVTAPYEKSLTTMPKRERVAWASRVQPQLLEILPSGAEVIVLADHDIERGSSSSCASMASRSRLPWRGLGSGNSFSG